MSRGKDINDETKTDPAVTLRAFPDKDTCIVYLTKRVGNPARTRMELHRIVDDEPVLLERFSLGTLHTHYTFGGLIEGEYVVKAFLEYPDGTFGASDRFAIDHSATVVSTVGTALDMDVAVGTDRANVYVGNKFRNISNTYVRVFFVADGIRYKHFTYVLEKDKTRTTLTDLLPGTYLVQATQTSVEGETAAGEITFEIQRRPEPASAERAELLLSKVDELLRRLD